MYTFALFIVTLFSIANSQPDIGACCLRNAICVTDTLDDCRRMGGSSWGNTTCYDGYCPWEVQPYVDELPRPVVKKPKFGRSGCDGGSAHYEISVTEFQQKLHRDIPPTTLWGYDGQYPGQTIEACTHSPVTISWKNDLRDTSKPNSPYRVTHYLPVDRCPHGPNFFGSKAIYVTHLHGAHTSPDSDGYPEAYIAPGQKVTYTYPNNQNPATLWYHDHTLGITRLNVYMGLAGFYLLRDKYEESLSIPSGKFEIPLVIQDKALKSDGSLYYPENFLVPLSDEFVATHYFVVNGKIWPFTNVAGGKYRLRILNGCQSRTIRIFFSRTESTPAELIPFFLIATDASSIPSPIEQDKIILAPAERVTIVIDFEKFAPGTRIYLRNDAPAPWPAGNTIGLNIIEKVMLFQVTSEPGYTQPLPQHIRNVEALPATSLPPRRYLLDGSPIPEEDPVCGGRTLWTIGNATWDDVTDTTPYIGSVEIWEFINPTDAAHPMHLHLTKFQVINRQPIAVDPVDGSIRIVGDAVDPLPYEIGWKDTVRVDTMTITRIIANFLDFTGRFPFHCHLLDHEDNAMMRQFVVINNKETCNNNGICEKGEDCYECKDCPWINGFRCGNGICEAAHGENCNTCPTDCASNSQICCGLGGSCDVVRSDFCRSGRYSCREAQVLPQCCGDNVCVSKSEENKVTCPVDCAAKDCTWAPWSSWSKCENCNEHNVGSSTRERSKSFAIRGGKECEGAYAERKSCKCGAPEKPQPKPVEGQDYLSAHESLKYY